MLVLTRKPQERIRIGDQIVITVVRVQGQSVRIGIEAPAEMHIRRAELTERERKSLAGSEADSVLGQPEVRPSDATQVNGPDTIWAVEMDVPTAWFSAGLGSPTDLLPQNGPMLPR